VISVRELKEFMNTKTVDNKTRFAKASFILGIASLVTSVMMFSLSGVSMGIPFGIFGIACAIIAKEDGEMPKKAKVGLILSIIGLIIGFIVYFLTYEAMVVMSDPESSKEVMKLMNEIFPELPENFENIFREML